MNIFQTHCFENNIYATQEDRSVKIKGPNFNRTKKCYFWNFNCML